jgi:hypothetical protein
MIYMSSVKIHFEPSAIFNQEEKTLMVYRMNYKTDDNILVQDTVKALRELYRTLSGHTTLIKIVYGTVPMTVIATIVLQLQLRDLCSIIAIADAKRDYIVVFSKNTNCSIGDRID